jgi:mRNA interferase MazF
LAREVNRGEVWLHRFRSPDKKRPVLVISRQEVIPLLHTVMVAPITSTIRGLPGEVPVGISEGLKHESAVNLDHVHTVEKSQLVSYQGSLDSDKMRQVCRALSIAAGCDLGH